MKQIDDMNYYELLGITTDSPDEKIQEAYLLAVSIYKADSIASYSIIPDEERETILKKIDEAFSTINDPPKRKAYNEQVLKFFPKEKSADSSDDNKPADASSTPQPQRPKSFWDGILSSGKQEDDLNEQKEEPDREIQQKEPVLEVNGGYLKNIREVKGITLKEIAQETRISMAFLQAIEDDNLSELPAVIYAHGFIKAYAKYVGLDPGYVIEHYDFKNEGEVSEVKT